MDRSLSPPATSSSWLREIRAVQGAIRRLYESKGTWQKYEKTLHSESVNSTARVPWRDLSATKALLCSGQSTVASPCKREIEGIDQYGRSLGIWACLWHSVSSFVSLYG